MDKNRTVVRVAGQEFKLAGFESEEYMQQLAAYVNKKVEEIAKMYPSLSTSNCVILASLNMADELNKAKEDYEALDLRINQLRDMPRSTASVPVKRPFETKQPEKVK
ncbi:MAG: cell division protein ZapA [Clostridia bacterium]|nr:cell division protein ZapA [Clostridia bacterium]